MGDHEDGGPSPPPAEEQDREDDDELYPFVDVTTGDNASLVVRAGWADAEGKVAHLVIDHSGGAGSPAALSMYEAALEWYRDVVAAIAREAQESE